MSQQRYSKYLEAPNVRVPQRTFYRRKRQKLDSIISGNDQGNVGPSEAVCYVEPDDDDLLMEGQQDDDSCHMSVKSTSSEADANTLYDSYSDDCLAEDEEIDANSTSHHLNCQENGPPPTDTSHQNVINHNKDYSSGSASQLNMENSGSVNSNIDFENYEDLQFSDGSELSCCGSLISESQHYINAENYFGDNLLGPSAYHIDENCVVEEELPGELPDNLCACTTTTEGEALFMILALGKRHNLSWLCMEDMLKMVNVLFKRVVVPKSKYFLLKYSEPDRSKEIFHIYCPQCNSYLEGCKKGLEDKAILCPCGQQIPSAKAASSFFMTLGLAQQVRQLLENPEVSENLEYRFERKKIHQDNFEDLYDGAWYHKHSQPGGPLYGRNNYSYCFNLDGCSPGRSSFKQIWPIYVTLNEIPPKLRIKHMLLVGLWVGKAEPDMQTILQPFVEEANALSTDGLTWNLNGEEKLSKVIPFCCIVDSHARCQVLNMKMYNGYFGCTMCMHPGDATTGGVRYGMHDEVTVERTDATLRRDMRKGYEKNRLNMKRSLKIDVNGCKGISGLYGMKYLDLSVCLVGDYMHLIKGVVEQHLNNLFGSYSACYVIDPHVANEAIVSERLVSLCHPSVISRDPRPLSEREKWKCSELRAFLLFYGPVVMKGIVKDKYVAHFSMLSLAIHILLQKSISRQQIRFKNQLLIKYVILYEKYFELVSMTYNIHLLTHVVKEVLNFGPIWTHNCFPYEEENHFLLLLFKSLSHAAKEIVRKHRVFQHLPQICMKFNATDDVIDYCEELFQRPLKRFIRSNNVTLMGVGNEYVLSDEEELCLIQQGLSTELVQTLSFDRVLCAGVKLSTASYSANLKKDDSGVFLKSGTICRIVKIVRISYACDTIVVLFGKRAVTVGRHCLRTVILT